MPEWKPYAESEQNVMKFTSNGPVPEVEKNDFIEFMKSFIKSKL